MTPRRTALLLLLPLAAGCGPTDDEASRAVLLASPVVVGAGLLVTWLLARFWQRLDEQVELNAKPALIAIAVLLPLSLAALAGVPPYKPVGTPPRGLAELVEGVLEWVPEALWWFGTSYLTILLVTWRVWLHVRPRTASTWAFLVPLVVSLAPVPNLMGGGWEPPWPHISTDAWAEIGATIWLYPGWAGMIAGPVAGVLALEVALRLRHRRKMVDAALEAPCEHAPPRSGLAPLASLAPLGGAPRHASPTLQPPQDTPAP